MTSRLVWATRARFTRGGTTITITRETRGHTQWATGVTRAIDGDAWLGDQPLRDWWAPRRRLRAGNHLPMWDTRGLPRPAETLPRLAALDPAPVVQVWWTSAYNMDLGNAGTIDWCARGTILDVTDGVAWVGRDTGTGVRVPLDAVVRATAVTPVPDGALQ